MTFKKRLIFPLGFLGLLLLILALGPRKHFQQVESKISPMVMPLEKLDGFLAEKESTVANLKPENQSRIIWADSIRQTAFAVVYLHGFSAGPMEGAPLHQEFAKRYGCNLYLPRLAGHGIDDRESFVDLTPEALVQSAREAIAIGKLLGKKVILMSCSTGSTLSAFLAANNPEDIDFLMMYSPNFALEDKASRLLTGPWGLQLARRIFGSKYYHLRLPKECHPYWTVQYRLEGVIALQGLLDQTMSPTTYQKISQPFFIGYYYKNEAERDFVISIEEIKKFAQLTSTPASEKWVVPFAEANSHVIVSDLQSEDLESVFAKSFEFAETVMGLQFVTATELKSDD